MIRTAYSFSPSGMQPRFLETTHSTYENQMSLAQSAGFGNDSAFASVRSGGFVSPNFDP